MTDQPTDDQFEVAIEALRTDASTWQGFADTMAGAATAADGLTIDSLAFSWVGEQIGISAAYEDVRALMAKLLSEGVQNFRDVAAALIASADAYEQDEINAASRMTGLEESLS